MAPDETTTAITDALLAGALALFAGRLAGAGSSAARLWSAGFASSAVAAAAGAVRHGLFPGSAGGLWLTTALAVGLASCLLLAGAAVAATVGATRWLILAGGAAKLVLYAGWIVGHRDYAWTAADAVLGVAALLALLWRASRAGAWSGFGLVLRGFALGVAGAALRQTELDPHPYLNHNDLFHLIAIGALWLVHRGGCQLRDHPDRPRT